MWGLRNLGKIKAVREIVKYIFSIIYKEGKVISIARGPLYGMRWHCHSAHQFWMPMGVYEKETAQWLSENINENDIFFDIGANAGYFTLLGSRHVGDGGKVISFDPIETNVETIKKHLDNNSTTNVVIEQAAVSDYVGGADFVVERNNANSHLQDIEISHAVSNSKGVVSVSVTTIDEYCRRNDIEPSIIKVDVEGAELHVLSGAKDILGRHHAKWIISTHSDTLFQRCSEIMRYEGYSVSSLRGFHHELICFPSR